MVGYCVACDRVIYCVKIHLFLVQNANVEFMICGSGFQ
jgi:hypothetical protein